MLYIKYYSKTYPSGKKPWMICSCMSALAKSMDSSVTTGRAKLLILDEPFVDLDPSVAHLMKDYLPELCESGSAVFFSTHVLEVAEKLCDQITIIKNGKLVQRQSW